MGNSKRPQDGRRNSYEPTREELAGERGRAVSHGEYNEIVADRVLRTRRS